MAAPRHRDASGLVVLRRVAQWGFPKRYPLVQFPNAPLLVALAASVVGWFVTGTVQSYVTAVGTVGIAVWAWGELVDGVNLFRHTLGLVVLVSTVINLAHRLA
jgi:hypothetical protein